MPLKNVPNEHTFSNLEKAAVKWWESLKHPSMTFKQHISDPIFNTRGEEELKLAIEASNLVMLAIALKLYDEI